MFQLVYISSATPGETVSMGQILTASRRNNTRDAITGLLYANGQRFLQALEGPEDKVLSAMARIQRDGRHRAIVVLSTRTVEDREFGAWAMAHHDTAQDGDRAVEQVGRLVANASPSVKATFEGFCQMRRAA